MITVGAMAMAMVLVLLGCITTGDMGDTGDTAIIVLIDGIIGTTGAGAAMVGPVMVTVMDGAVMADIMADTDTHTMATAKAVMATTVAVTVTIGAEGGITITIPWPITMLEMPYEAVRTLRPAITIRPGTEAAPI